MLADHLYPVGRDGKIAASVDGKSEATQNVLPSREPLVAVCIKDDHAYMLVLNSLVSSSLVGTRITTVDAFLPLLGFPFLLLL